MKEGYNSIVSLNDLLLKVNIGETKKERDIQQDKKIRFKLFYKNYPEGCITDEITETDCYHKIAEISSNYCHNNNVRLLEYLCFGLHKKIREVVASDVKIWVKIEKCNPPIAGMLGGTSFEYADF
jgi:dihydroneopterin aldolase